MAIIKHSTRKNNSIDTGVDPFDVVRLDAAAKLPAVDGSQLTNITGTGPTTIGGLTDVDTTTVAPVNTDILSFDGTNWVPAAASAGGASASNDLTDVANTTPADKHVLVYDGVTDNRYENRLLTEADISDLQSYALASHNHVLADITDSGTAAALNVGTAANNVVQLDGTGKLPAVDGSLLTGIVGAGGGSGGSGGAWTFVDEFTVNGISTNLNIDGTSAVYMLVFHSMESDNASQSKLGIRFNGDATSDNHCWHRSYHSNGSDGFQSNTTTGTLAAIGVVVNASTYPSAGTVMIYNDGSSIVNVSSDSTYRVSSNDQTVNDLYASAYKNGPITSAELIDDAGSTLTGKVYVYKLNTTAGAGGGSFVGANAYRSTVQSIPTGFTPTDITFDNVQYDDGSFISTPSTDVVIPSDGTYSIAGTGSFTSNASGDTRIIQIAVDGAVQIRDTKNPQTGTDTGMYISTEVQLTAGQVVKLQAIQNSGGNLDFGHASAIGLQAQLHIHKIAGGSGAGGASTLDALTDVANTTPANKHVLVYDGVTDNRYENRLLTEADISDLQSYALASHNHVLADITDSGTAAALNVGTAANNVVQLDGTGKLPAVDGSLLTGIVGAGGGGAGAWEYVETVTLSGISHALDMDGTVDSYMLIGTDITCVGHTGGGVDIGLQFNDDTASNYLTTRIYSGSASAVGSGANPVTTGAVIGNGPNNEANRVMGFTATVYRSSKADSVLSQSSLYYGSTSQHMEQDFWGSVWKPGSLTSAKIVNLSDTNTLSGTVHVYKLNTTAGAGGASAYTAQPTTTTLTGNSKTLADTTSAAVAYTLPVGVVGEFVEIVDIGFNAAVNNITVTPQSGEKVDNIIDDVYVVDVNGGNIKMIFTTTRGWQVIPGFAITETAAATYISLITSLGPTLWLKLDETSGTTVTDSSGNAFTGNISGTPTFSQPSLVGDPGTSMLFDSANADHLAIPHNVAMDSTDFTWLMMLKPSVAYNNTLADHVALITHVTGSTKGYNLLYLTTQTLRISKGTGTTWDALDYSTTFTSGQTYQVGMRYNSTTGIMAIIIDGAIVATKSMAALVYGGTADTRIGRGEDANNRYVKGTLDDIVFFDRALTDAEISDIYGQTS